LFNNHSLAKWNKISPHKKAHKTKKSATVKVYYILTL